MKAALTALGIFLSIGLINYLFAITIADPPSGAGVVDRIVIYRLKIQFSSGIPANPIVGGFSIKPGIKYNDLIRNRVAGISATDTVFNMAGLWWSLWTANLIGLGLFIAKSRRLKQLEAFRSSCPKCRYPRAGIASQRCPECGLDWAEPLQKN